VNTKVLTELILNNRRLIQNSNGPLIIVYIIRLCNSGNAYFMLPLEEQVMQEQHVLGLGLGEEHLQLVVYDEPVDEL
jgi:hypothetical protein